MELERRLSLFICFLIVGLATSVCIGVRGAARGLDEARVARELKSTQVAFQQFEAERFSNLENQLRMVSELPQIKAVIGAADRAMISKTLDTFRENLHIDFLVAFDEEGKPFGAKHFTHLEDLLKQTADSSRSKRGYVYDQNELKQVVLVPLIIAGKVSATLVAEVRFDEEIISRLKNLNHTEITIAHASGESSKDGFQSLGFDLVGGAGEKVAHVVVSKNIAEGTSVISKVRWLTIGLACIFCFLGVLMSYLLGRSVSKPLQRFTLNLKNADVSDVETLKKIPELLEEMGVDANVKALIEELNRIVLVLANDHERASDHLAERAQNIEKDLAILKSQNIKLTEANARLIRLLQSIENQGGTRRVA